MNAAIREQRVGEIHSAIEALPDKRIGWTEAHNQVAGRITQFYREFTGDETLSPAYCHGLFARMMWWQSSWFERIVFLKTARQVLFGLLTPTGHQCTREMLRGFFNLAPGGRGQ